MTAGFYCLNDFGTVLIDDTASNIAMALRGDTTVNYTTPHGEDTWRWALQRTLPGAVSPIVAFSSEAYVSGLKLRKIPGTDFVGGKGGGDTGTTDAEVLYMIFDRPVMPVGIGDAALQIFNAAGELCFDSRLKHAIVAAVVTVPSATPVVTTLLTGRKYMAMDTVGLMCKIVDNVVYVKAQGVSHYGKSMIILDVTDY